MLSLSFIKEIEKIIGRENVLTGEADRQNYAYDAAVLPPVVPGLVVRPTRTDQLGPHNSHQGDRVGFFRAPIFSTRERLPATSS